MKGYQHSKIAWWDENHGMILIFVASNERNVFCPLGIGKEMICSQEARQ